MAEYYRIKRETLVGLADDIRRLGNISGELSLSRMKAILEVTSQGEYVPPSINIEERVPSISLCSRLSLVPSVDELTINIIWKQQTISSESLSEWDYNSRYVELGKNGVQFRTTWEYESEEQPVETGRMTILKITTSDLASVESLEVRENG